MFQSMVFLQTLVAALLVIGSAGYAAWTLMPGAGRRWLAAWLLRRVPGLPASLAARLRAASQASAGCGCDGCDHAPAKQKSNAALKVPAKNRSASAPQPVVFHPRVRR